MQCREGRAGQGGRIYMPLLLLLIGWHEFSSISKTGYQHFILFSKEFYYNWREPYLTRCWAAQLKVKLILAEGCQKLHPKAPLGLNPGTLFWKS
jgi:hypothetical protein